MVGDILREERERQKFSLKDIEQGTSIRAVYIEAIENGEYDKLPGNVYTKGFIKNYGNFLKLDGDALSRQFTEEVTPQSAPIVTESESSNPVKSNEVTINETADIVSEPIPDINEQRTSEPEIKIATRVGRGDCVQQAQRDIRQQEEEQRIHANRAERSEKFFGAR